MYSSGRTNVEQPAFGLSQQSVPYGCCLNLLKSFNYRGELKVNLHAKVKLPCLVILHHQRSFGFAETNYNVDNVR